MRPISKGGVGSGVKGHETAQPARQSDKERKNEREMEEAMRLAQEEIEAGHRFRADRYKIQSLVNFLQVWNEKEKQVAKGGPGSGRHKEISDVIDEELLARFQTAVESDKYYEPSNYTPIDQDAYAQQAKMSVAEQISQYFTTDQRQRLAARAAIVTYDPIRDKSVTIPTDQLTPAQEQEAVLIGVGILINKWAGTSNDHDPESLAIQETAKRVFGLKDTLDWTMYDQGVASTPLENKEVQKFLADNGDIYETFLKAQYKLTQDFFKEHGITEVTVYRGFKFGYGADDVPEWAKQQVENNSKDMQSKYQGKDLLPPYQATIPLRPLSSFSYSPLTAYNFATRVVATATIPVKDILSTALTGVGCLHEKELVVLGNQREWTIGNGEGFVNETVKKGGPGSGRHPESGLSLIHISEPTRPY